MNIIQFRGHMRPDAMDRLADEQTRAVRRKHDNAYTRPIRKPSVMPTISLDKSWKVKVLAWFARWFREV